MRMVALDTKEKAGDGGAEPTTIRGLEAKGRFRPRRSLVFKSSDVMVRRLWIRNSHLRYP